MEKLVYAVVFGFIMLVGLPFNAVSLWILIRRHSLQPPNAVFMVNLAISDLLLIVSLPLRVYFYATGTWPLSSTACICTVILFRINIRLSSIFITCISVDRLLAFVYPLRSRHLRTSSNAWRAVALIWLLVLATSIPENVYYAKLFASYNESTCFTFYQHLSIHPISYLYSVLVLTMLAVNIVCTALVSWTLRRHLRDPARVKNKVNVMLIFVMNLIMFTICFFPASILVFVRTPSAITPLTCLATMNCCLDPVLYYFSFDGFWRKKEDVALPREQETMAKGHAIFKRSLDDTRLPR